MPPIPQDSPDGGPGRPDAPSGQDCLDQVLGLALEAISGESPGSRIGTYRLIEPLGSGGFGTVWRAEQEEPVRREVALKILKLGMDTREVMARFETERQALAMMSHPHIATVFEAGTTETGRPYFVMELVPGIPINEFCDQNQLSLAERLDLFMKVCQGVLHAHQKGIIHRDLKPSNILVSRIEGESVPKIIDFGIAKARSQSIRGHYLLTGMHSVLGTPVYSSPEQIDTDEHSVDIRSDVYSLGVILYELLTGYLPFEVDVIDGSSIERVRQIVCEVDPPRPSQRLRSLNPDVLETVAKLRKTKSPELLRQLQGDIDWVIMRCLEKDRARRYDSVSVLIQELNHFASHQPVTARPPTLGYVVGKTIRRHRQSVLFIGVTLTALSTGLVLAMTGYHRAIKQQRVTDEARQQAQKLVGFILDDLRPELATYGRSEYLIDSLEMAHEYYNNLPPELQGPDSMAAHATTLENLAAVYSGTSGLPEPENLSKAHALLEEALKHREEVARLLPEDPEARSALIWTEHLLIRTTLSPSEWNATQVELISRYREMEKQFPGNRKINARLAQLLVNRGFDASANLGHPDEALSASIEACQRYEGILAEEPDNPALLISCAIAYASQVHAKWMAFRNGIFDLHGDPEGILYLGRKGMDYARQAIAADPGNQAFLANGSVAATMMTVLHADFLAEGFEDSVATGCGYLERLAILDPRNPEWPQQIAILRMMEGKILRSDLRLLEAQGKFEKVMELTGSNLDRKKFLNLHRESILQAGITHAIAGDPEAARYYLNLLQESESQVVAMEPVSPLAAQKEKFGLLLQRCTLLEELGDWKEVEQLARAMLEAAQTGLKDFPEEYFEWLPRCYNAEAMLGRALVRQDQGQAALHWLKLAKSGITDSDFNMSASAMFHNRWPVIYEDLGDAFGQLERWNEAGEHWKEALAKWESESALRGPRLSLRLNKARLMWKLATIPENPDLQINPGRRSELLSRALALLSGQDADHRLTSAGREMREAIRMEHRLVANNPLH